jgi:hypothetical protein
VALGRGQIPAYRKIVVVDYSMQFGVGEIMRVSGARGAMVPLDPFSVAPLSSTVAT